MRLTVGSVASDDVSVKLWINVQLDERHTTRLPITPLHSIFAYSCLSINYHIIMDVTHTLELHVAPVYNRSSLTLEHFHTFTLTASRIQRDTSTDNKGHYKAECSLTNSTQ